MNNVIDEALLKVLDFKNKNATAIEELNKKFNDADEIIFKETCHKPYLKRCEPEFCTFRINDTCKYPHEYTRLKAILDK